MLTLLLQNNFLISLTLPNTKPESGEKGLLGVRGRHHHNCPSAVAGGTDMPALWEQRLPERVKWPLLSLGLLQRCCFRFNFANLKLVWKPLLCALVAAMQILGLPYPCQNSSFQKVQFRRNRSKMASLCQI